MGRAKELHGISGLDLHGCPRINLIKLLQVSVIYNNYCSYCIQTLKQWLHL